MGWALSIHQADITDASIVEEAPGALQAGQARLAVRRFALTANNITYAAFGEAMGYWRFFPGADGRGRLPVWGFAEVTESRAEGLAAGERVYGYLPAASGLVVTPARYVRTALLTRLTTARTCLRSITGMNDARRPTVTTRPTRRYKWCCSPCF